MTTAWDNLPNAKHIDAVLAHVKQHPDKWGATEDADYDDNYDNYDNYDGSSDAEFDPVRDADRDAAWDAAYGAALDAALDAARGDAWDAAWDAAVGAAWGTAWAACAALVAWDDASDLLAMPVDAVRLLAACNHHPAVILLPAVIALAKD